MKRSFSLILIGVWLSLAACGESVVAPTAEVALRHSALDALPARIEWDVGMGVRVVHDPYRGIDWEGARFVSVQLHDHIGVDTARIRAYDRAGYGAVSMLDYSGVSWLPFARTHRLWPPDSHLTPEFVASLENIQALIPGAEEVGYGHVVSAFLTSFIFARRPWDLPRRGSYSSTQEAVHVTQERGGLAFLAHPWGPPRQHRGLSNLDGVEIYNAYAAVKEREGRHDLLQGSHDAGAAMVAVWDDLLSRDQTVRGIAVNDHYGPDDTELGSDDGLRDSGRVLLVAENGQFPDVRDALQTGRFFAVRDQGRVKSAHLMELSLRTDSASIRVKAEGVVSWMSEGRRIATGSVLWLDSVPSLLRYARAEIQVGDSVKVFSQPFRLRPQRAPFWCVGSDRVSNPPDGRCRPLSVPN